jgi:hypothetical protein
MRAFCAPKKLCGGKKMKKFVCSIFVSLLVTGYLIAAESPGPNERIIGIIRQINEIHLNGMTLEITSCCIKKRTAIIKRMTESLEDTKKEIKALVLISSRQEKHHRLYWVLQIIMDDLQEIEQIIDRYDPVDAEGYKAVGVRIYALTRDMTPTLREALRALYRHPLDAEEGWQ